jgi:cell division protein FtsI (penicillin-binding protein 3)
MNRLHTPEGRWIRRRMAILCGVLAVGMGIVVAAGYRLSMVDGAAWRELADKQRQRRLHVVPQRGTLYDRNGSALAVSVDVPSVSLDAVELMRGVSLQNQPAVARDQATRIAQALSLDPAQVERRILSKRRFVWLKRQISSEEADAVRRLVAGEDGTRVRGLAVEGEGRRYYPRRELAAPLLGFVAPDGLGKDGIEYSLNQQLQGQVERLQGLRDRNGRLIFSEGMDEDRSFAGHNIELTIDQGIQFVAERELALAAKTYEAAGGSVVVVDPRTGELLAVASWPGYNPNDYGDSEPSERRNRAVSDRFEPGSTMKIFTVAAGLASKSVGPTERMYCEKGQMPVDNVVIRDTHPAEWLTISQVLAVSSNICAAKIGLGLGGEALYEAFLRFGFGSPSDLPLPGESGGVLLPRSRSWVQVETAAASFGQGISVTNVQMAMAVAALANEGKLMEPVLVKRVTTAGGEVLQEASPRMRRQAVPASVARTVSEMMVAVTEGEGTGLSAALEGFTVAGKTATAQKADPLTGQYSLDKFTSSFVGFVPAKDPVVAISVVLDEPMVAHAGGDVAAPVFRRVAEMALKYRGLTPRGTDRVDLGQLARTADPANATYALLRQSQGKQPLIQESVAEQKPGQGQVRVPDMTGWPLRRVLKKSVELGLKPQVNGSGLVARQSPSPGEALDKGAVLLLELEPAS